MHKADVAIASVDGMVKAMKQAQDDVYGRLAKYKDPPIWKQLHDVGVKAEESGNTIHGMASMANPFLPDSVWSFPTNAPNPPPPPYSRYMNVNPIYQDYIKKHAYEISQTPAPQPLVVTTPGPPTA